MWSISIHSFLSYLAHRHTDSNENINFSVVEGNNGKITGKDKRLLQQSILLLKVTMAKLQCQNNRQGSISFVLYMHQSVTCHDTINK